MPLPGPGSSFIAENPGNPPAPAGVLLFQTSTPFSPVATSWSVGSPYLAHPNNPTADPTFLAYSPLNAGQFTLAYATGDSIFQTANPPATTGTKLFDYTAGPPAFSWRRIVS